MIEVFDLNGNKLYTIDMPEGTKERNEFCFMGDEEKLFVTSFHKTEVYVMDKSDMANGEWKLINVER